MADREPNLEPEPEATPPSSSHQHQEAAVTTGARYSELPELYAVFNAPLWECFKRIALDLEYTVAPIRLNPPEFAKQPITDGVFALYLVHDAPLSEYFKRAAHELKLTIVAQTFGLSGELEVEVKDYTLYSGLLGTAFLLFKSYQVTGNAADLVHCSQIVKACDNASLRSRDVTFLSGRAGVCALGAVAALHSGNERLMEYYMLQFQKIEVPNDYADDLKIGRAGFLWACLFLNKHIGQDTIPYQYTARFVDEIIKNGRALGRKGVCPLMFESLGEKYWGASHGLAGIMHVLMDMKLKPDELEDVKGTLKYMIRNRLPSGNYPISEVDRNDVLLNWCHGAPGIVITLVKAAKVFGDKEFLDAAMQAAKVVWEQGLHKRVGICHGISGNAYVFLSLYQHTGDVEYLAMARCFTCSLLDRAHKEIPRGEMHGGDQPYSLFDGIGGLAYLLLDMVDPTQSKFPAYEL
ncbi:lanC-like protein GCL2 [Lotus japonicus]|uniref:lanC-like protein GCL2 n=1 Tax=Lotus japonicus TaxID=34305 RepID=UPI0025908FA6|nr:lanC-like protein GCL2 [Lotus japonicus]